MISLSKSGGTVTFAFDDNSGYLQNGTIEVPVNSLSLVIDESNMVTFKKSASNDIFVSANIAEFGMSKSELESWYKDNMVGSTGGGGATYTAGRGIDIDSGNTISFTLPISAGTGNNSIAEGNGTTASGQMSHAEGYYATASGQSSHAEGSGTKANGLASHAEGSGTIANGLASHTEGSGTRAYNDYEHASGCYNVSSSASTTFGDSGNTLFSVGNGDFITGRHNAFEIRQNGDIYITSGNTDIKLQDNLGGGISSGEVQSMIDESISGKADTSAVTQSINAATSGAVGSFGDFYVDIDDEGYEFLYLGYGNQEGVGLGAIKFAGEGSGLYESNGLLTVVGKVNESTFNSYSASTNTALNGKVNTSSVVTAVTSASTDSQIPTAKAVYDAIPTGGTGGGNPTVELTQAEYDALVTAGTVSADTYYIITDATPVDVSNYWTSAQTQSAITQATSGKADTSAVTEQISEAVSGKVDTSAITSAVTSASTDSEIPTAKAVYDAIPTGGTGGGKAVSGGTNISITTGATADTINCTLPISADTKSITINRNNIRFGSSTTSNPNRAQFAFGDNCSASGTYSMAMGAYAQASNYCTFAYGYRAVADNQYQTSFGRNPLSSVGSSTFGDSGNTLFCVGNALANNDDSRHNAFEIRQNGDIYITLDGQDVKLQDNLGGGGSVDQTVISGSTNAVSGGAVYDQLGGMKIVKLTESEYTALVTKDSDTLYVVVPDPSN